jgi:hypothetical protein
MSFQGRYTEAGSLLGSWPILPSVISGTPVLLPRTMRSSAVILGIQREPAAGFDVDGASFILNVDGSDYNVSFSYGSFLPLSVVISQINADVGTTVAFNDNGFLKLQSPTAGGASYLKVKSDPLSASGDVLKNLGLFAETEAYAGDFIGAQHVDPDRQVATPNQMAMAEGESFEAKVFNRAIAQLALNNDRNEGLLSKKRLAARSTVDIGSYSAPGAVDGYQMSGGNLIYVGKTSTPSRTALMKLFALLDSEGRELTKEMYPAAYTGYTGTFNMQKVITGHDQGRLVVVSSAFNAGDSFEKGNYYLACNTFTGDAAALNGKLLKIIEVRSGLGASSEAVVDNVDPATGLEVTVAPQSRSFTIFTRQQARVVVDGVFENLAAAVAGTPRLENVQVTKRSSLAPTRVELGNRVVVAGQDFLSSPAVQAGDLLTWTGSTIDAPFNNNGSYRVERVIDKQTLQVVSSDWGAAFINPDFTSGTVGTFDITSDGAFVLDPFLRFANDSSNPPPTAGQALSIAYLKGTTFRQATDDDPAMLGGDLSFSQEADDTLTQAVLRIWGSGVTTLDEILYGDARVNLKSIEDRLDTEHYRYDEADKSGSGATDTRSWGRHKDINPDTINMVYWDPGSLAQTPRVTLSGTGTVRTSDLDGEDIILEVANTLSDEVLWVTGRGHINNRTGNPSVHAFIDLLADGNTDRTGLGSAVNTGDRYLQRLGHKWSGADVGSSVNSLITQELSTNITTTTSGTFPEVTGQRIQMDIGAAAKPAVTDYRWSHLKGTLTSDGTGSIGTLYGIHIDYDVSAPLVITNNHYGLKIEDIARASGTNYAVYTGLGSVLFGDYTSIVLGTKNQLNSGLAITGTSSATSGSWSSFSVNTSVSHTTGTVAQYRAAEAIAAATGVGGTTTSVTGLYAVATSASHTTTDLYGIQVGDCTGGVNSYSIYTGAGIARFGDLVQIDPTRASYSRTADLYINSTMSVNVPGSFWGIYSSPTNVFTSGTTTRWVGIAALPAVSGPGTCTDLIGMYATASSGGGKTVTRATGLWIDSLTNLGSVATSHGLYVADQSGATNNYAIYTNLGLVYFGDIVTITKTLGGTRQVGLSANLTAATSGPISYGVLTQLAHSASSTVDGVGILSLLNYGATGTISSVVGHESVFNVSHASGTLSSAIGFRSRMQGAATGSITNAYHFYAGASISSAPTGTEYGLYVDSLTQATNSYAIYTGTGKVRIGDRVEIIRGSSLPTSEDTALYATYETANISGTATAYGMRVLAPVLTAQLSNNVTVIGGMFSPTVTPSFSYLPNLHVYGVRSNPNLGGSGAIGQFTGVDSGVSGGTGISGGIAYMFRATASASASTFATIYGFNAYSMTGASSIYGVSTAYPCIFSGGIGVSGAGVVDVGGPTGYYKDIYCNRLLYKSAPTTFDSYDDLALVEGYTPTSDFVTVSKAGQDRVVQKGDASTIPWPMLSKKDPTKRDFFFDIGDSMMFLLGALKQLYKKHKSETFRLQERIDVLESRLRA